MNLFIKKLLNFKKNIVNSYVVLITGIIVFLLSVYFDVFKKIIKFFVEYEQYQIGQIITIMTIFFIFLSYFFFRKWEETKLHNEQLYSMISKDLKDDKKNKEKILESELIKALEKEEFIIYYQPQMDLKTKQIIGLEALLRWNHPEKGMISPAYFIPLAEKSGFIISLGEWVLWKVCEQNKLWQEAGYNPVPIAVNVSGHQLEHVQLVDTISKILEFTGMDSEYLVLEITESIALRDVKNALNTLEKLNEMGIKVHIDDFGTGYSSLSYLKDYPIYNVKIDKSFVQNISLNIKGNIIISAVVALAHKLKLKVLAEGVETAYQLKFLEDCNCDAIQGYLVGKPTVASEIEVVYLTRNI